MSLLAIAWRNFEQRRLSSLLTTVALALGVMLTVLVLCIYGIVSDAFRRNASVGYSMVVGAKGSPLQLTLNTVYYLSKPVENIPYSYYLEFLPGNGRQQEIAELGGRIKDPERPGSFSPFMMGGFAVPVCLGDYFGEFRVVGTTPDFFEKLQFGPNVDQPFTFADGRNMQEWTAENGYWEAVVGSRVAKEMQVGVGDVINPAHGDPEGHGHSQGFTIVGVLDPTGTPNDRAAFVNMEGFYLMDGHADTDVEEEEGSELVSATASDPGSPGSQGSASDESESGSQSPTLNPLPIHQREVTAILLRPAMPAFGLRMQNVINEGLQAQAATPVGEITRLMEAIVGPIQQALLVITVITCVVAAVGILVSIYNSMNDRRRDIAVMRALGARRGTVMWVILLESFLIAIFGGVLGWAAAHGLIVAAAPLIEEHTGILVGFFSFSPQEVYVLPLVLGLASLAGFLPALVAYRTDVSSALS